MPPSSDNQATGAPPPAPAREARTLRALVGRLAGPVGMLILGLAVMMFQNQAAQQQRAAAVLPSAFNATEPRTCDISPTGREVQRFAQFLTYPTVSNASAMIHISPDRLVHFDAALTFLKEQYNLVWEHLSVERVGAGGYSLLITWPGSDTSLKPVMFISHYDVVPVTAEKMSEWLHGPFDGKIIDGVIWGRGALDIKFSVTSLLEAITRLLKSGYQPRRTVILTFGHDEEVGGELGAGEIAKLLKGRGVKLDIIVDEGGTVFSDGLKGLMDSPVAVIGTAEKMYLSMEVTFHGAGGHSSQPPIDYSDVATQMSRFQANLAVKKPAPVLRSPIPEFLSAVAPKAASWKRPLLFNADTWGVRTLLADQMSKSSPATNALVRTTYAVTRMNTGVSDNVLPQIGKMTINSRHHPYIPQAEVMKHVEDILQGLGLKADMQLTSATFSGPPGKVTSVTGRHYQLLKQAIQEYWWSQGEPVRDTLLCAQPVTVAPMLLTGGTDSKWYSELSAHGILRFVPYFMLSAPPADGSVSPVPPMATVHASNERVRAEDYARLLARFVKAKPPDIHCRPERRGVVNRLRRVRRVIVSPVIVTRAHLTTEPVAQRRSKQRALSTVMQSMQQSEPLPVGGVSAEEAVRRTQLASFEDHETLSTAQKVVNAVKSVVEHTYAEAEAVSGVVTDARGNVLNPRGSMELHRDS